VLRQQFCQALMGGFSMAGKKAAGFRTRFKADRARGI
jgi:hypothetical protein